LWTRQVPIHTIMRLYPKKRPVPWWKKPAWWQVIVAVLALTLATVQVIRIVWSARLGPAQIDTVPVEWYKGLRQELDSVTIEYHNLQLEYDRLLDSIKYLSKTPVVLNIYNLTQPPASFRFIADSLESLIYAGLVVHPEMLLKIGNACFAVGDYERALRFYWRVPASDQDSRHLTYFEIAVHNCGVVSGVLGDDKDRKRLFDFVYLLGAAR
jgi:hypothetical protein